MVLLLAASAATPAHSDVAWRWTADVVVDIARASGVEISPDGRSAVYALSRPRTGEALGGAWTNLWLAPLDGPAPRRLTWADAEDGSPAWSPDGSKLAFTSARGEKAKTRIWILPLAGGEATPLTGEKVSVEGFAWAPDGRSIAYIAMDPKSEQREKDEKAGRDWTVVDRDLRPRRLWVVTVADGAARAVASAGDLSAWQMAWAPDSKSMVATLSATSGTDESYMSKRVMVLPVDPPDGKAIQLVGVVGKVDQVAWSKDGRQIAYRAGVDVSDPYSGSVFVVPAGGGIPVNLTGDRHESVNHIEWLPDGRIAVVAVRGTRSVLYLQDPPGSGKHRMLVDAGAQVFTSASFSKDGRRFALAASAAEHPPEVFSGETSLRRRTDLNPQLAALPRGRQETLRYKASDGVDLEAVLIRPSGTGTKASWPLMVIAHGGPESQYLDGWNTSYSTPGQALAERGYFVIYPNYRGSTGRGVAFSKMDHKDLGGREFQDVIDAVNEMTLKFPVEKRRVGIMGGSYGGYFTALGATRYSERFAAGVFLFGISNWSSFMGQTDTPVENSSVHWNLWCYHDEKACWQASPVAYVNKATTALLMFQGAEDLRVPKPQSDELYAALKWKGVDVEYVVFPREKHGFRERAHQVETFDRSLAWLDRYLSPQR